MLKYKYIITLFLVAGIAVSCQKNFLDQVPDDRLTIDEVFSKRATSEEYLANVYNYIRDESHRDNTFQTMTDDLDLTYETAGSSNINIGKWSAVSGYYDYWKHYYQGIRSATYFMQNIGKNEQILKEGNAEYEIKNFIAQARFLRAYFYFCLLRQYGPVPIIGEDLIAIDASFEETQLPRNSYDECVAFIASELDKAATDLPDHFTGNSRDYGRATKAVCLAIKSRLYLYAASPLFNGNLEYADFRNKDGKQLVNQSYNINKWKQAADAAKELIDLEIFSLYKKNNSSGVFDPYLSYRDVFIDPWNEEVIFARNSNLLLNWEINAAPRPVNGFASIGVTQQLVDSYFMSNGLSPINGYNADGSPIINTASGYSETGLTTMADPQGRWLANTYNMYVNREPRFYATVSFNNSPWLNTDDGAKTVETYYRGSSGKAGSWDYSRTGYVIRKNFDPASNRKLNRFAARPHVMVRYAEILLNYIEALNEYDPTNTDIKKYLNDIRERAGIPLITAALDQGQMRTAIRKERRVELAAENIRYYDTRRWKIAPQTDGGPFYGMDIDAGTSLTDMAFYKRTVFENRVFFKNYYLFPIPQSEIDRNKNLVQNPGW